MTQLGKAQGKNMNYLEKLKDPRWQKLRLEIFDRDLWKCRKCNSTIKTLHAHHLYYEQWKEPWEYPLEAFLTLCEDCHEYETAVRRQAEEDFLMAARKSGLLSDDFSWMTYLFPHVKTGNSIVIRRAVEYLEDHPEEVVRLADLYVKG